MIDLLLRKISHVLIENSYWVNNVNLRQSFKSWANFLVSVKLVSFHMILNLDSFINGPRLSYHMTSDWCWEEGTTLLENICSTANNYWVKNISLTQCIMPMGFLKLHHDFILLITTN